MWLKTGADFISLLHFVSWLLECNEAIIIATIDVTFIEIGFHVWILLGSSIDMMRMRMLYFITSNFSSNIVVSSLTQRVIKNVFLAWKSTCSLIDSINDSSKITKRVHRLVKLCTTWNYSVCVPSVSYRPDFNRFCVYFFAVVVVVRIKLSVARVLFYHCV